ncbi:MAG: 6,7-dimethyl-8-ribityllumazine synthase [Alphaproteobacteria bacterium]
MPNPHILVVEARFYADISDALWEGAQESFDKVPVSYERLSVPGALEIPAAIRLAVEASDKGHLQKPYNGYLALGCVIRGETTHYDVIVNESARGLQKLALKWGLAIGNGILTVENDEQAWVRADKMQKNKGGEAANACLRMIELRRHFLHTSKR